MRREKLLPISDKFAVTVWRAQCRKRCAGLPKGSSDGTMVFQIGCAQLIALPWKHNSASHLQVCLHLLEVGS